MDKIIDCCPLRGQGTKEKKQKTEILKKSQGEINYAESFHENSQSKLVVIRKLQDVANEKGSTQHSTRRGKAHEVF